MSSLNRFRQWYLLHLVKPRCDRWLYRYAARQGVARILQLGLDDGQRTVNLLQWIHQTHPQRSVRFVGVDLFEGGGKARLTLKSAHRMLHRLGVSFQLLPGTPQSVLPRHANSILDLDLILFSATWVPEVWDRTWFYLPRMMAERGTILLAPQTADGDYQVIDRAEAERRGYASLAPRAA